MAKTVRSQRVTIAAGALSLALVAPFVSPVSVTPVAAAVDADAFEKTYDTTNFWDVNEAVVEGLVLEPGDKVEATALLLAQNKWRFRTSGCNLILVRPEAAISFRKGNQNIAVKVTKADGSSFDTTLKVNVVDKKAEGNTFTEPADACPTPEEPTEEQPTSEEPTPEAPSEQPTPTTTTPPAEEPSTSNAPKTTASAFNGRFNTSTFWNKKEAVVEGLKLQPGDKVEATALLASRNKWHFRNDNGTLTVIRPEAPASFGTGEQDIPVKVTTAEGTTFKTTLRLNIIDERPVGEWEKELDKTYPVDFEKSTSAKPLDVLKLPKGVTLTKGGASLPTGWSVTTDADGVRITPPATFKEGDIELPVSVEQVHDDGEKDAFKATLKIAAKNPSKTPAETAGTIADIAGPLIGNIIGGATGGTGLGSLIGSLIGGGKKEGSEGGNSGGGLGGVIGNALGGLLGGGKDGKSPLEGIVKVEVQPSGIIVTGNANPTVDIRDNGSNNGSNNSVVVTDNANPRDNGSNNSVVVTGNANPTVDIRDNANNNGNPSVVVTGNANPVVTGNANNNGSGNSAVVTNNANPVVTGNMNDNGSGNSVVVTNNANPSVVITDNANPRDNLNNNGSNNSVVATNNANPTVVITGNANDNGSNNNVQVTGNANPVITDNANGGLLGSSGSSNGGSSKKDKGGDNVVDANVNTTGGSSDPRCIASLVGLGLPLVALIPLALTQQMQIPGLTQANGQAAGSFDAAARNFGLDSGPALAIGGGVVGVVAALLITAAVRTCVPNVDNVDINVNVPRLKGAPETTVAPVVETQ